MEHLLILGNGITGTTVARHVRKRSDIPITVVSEESDYFYSRPAAHVHLHGTHDGGKYEAV
jgi:NADH dehydrogenase FAD-containing subunit